MSDSPSPSKSQRNSEPLLASDVERLTVAETHHRASSLSESLAPRLSHGDTASFDSDLQPESIVPSTSGSPLRGDDSIGRLSEPHYPLAAAPVKEPLPPTGSVAQTDMVEEEFAEYRPPTEDQLREAANLKLFDEDGNTVLFGELYPDWPGALATNPEAGLVYAAGDHLQPKTVVFFIRTMFCGQCQDYMRAAISRLDPEEISAANVRVVIITNGSWKGIKKYTQLMGSKFKIYIDPDLSLYRALGMNPKISGLEALAAIFKTPENRPAYHQSSTWMQTIRGLKTGSKLGVLNLGSPRQMGGEFVLQPGYKCSYAHRMPNKFSHAPAKNVVGKAGVKWPEGRRVVENIPDPAIAAIEQERLLDPPEEKTRMGWRRPLVETKERFSVDKALPALPG